MATPLVKLNDGRSIPQVGLGTWNGEPEKVVAAVKHAVKAGYRHIDCAAIYKNEAEIGVALSELFAEGVVTREELWITSKLWNDSHKAEDVPEALAKTLADLRLEYLDLYLIHWPVVSEYKGAELSPTIAETWGAMERVHKEGKAKSIGVSNFSAKKLMAMKDYASVFPSMNQVELHPQWRQDGLLEACNALGTKLTAYSPLGSPGTAEMIKHEGASLMQSDAVKAIAGEVSKSPAQVLVRWAVQRGTVVIPKSTNLERIESNFDVSAWELSAEHMKTLSTIEHQQRLLHGTFFCNEEGPYKTPADIWDE